MTEFIIEGIAASLIVWMTYWKRELFLYILSIPICGMFGFAFFERYPSNTGFVFAVIIISIGAYSLWKVFEILVDKIRG